MAIEGLCNKKNYKLLSQKVFTWCSSITVIRHLSKPLNCKCGIGSLKCIWKCKKCGKFIAKTASQIMVDLSKGRVDPDKVFSKTEIHFAESFLSKMRNEKGVRSVMCYACDFICMITKALSLKIISDH